MRQEGRVVMATVLGGMTGAQIFMTFLAVSSLTMAYLSRRSVPSIRRDEEQRQGWQINTCDNTIPLPIVLGRCRVGINRVYTGVSGEDNKFLHIIGNICEGEIEGIVNIGGVDQFFLDDDIYTKFGDKVYFEMFNGSPTQTVCATLHNAIPEWNEPKKNTAYIYIKLEYDQDLFNGLPQFSLLIDGMKVKDPRTGEVGFSRNGAVQAYDFCTRTRAGVGISDARLDAIISETADYCDEKGWTCDLVIKEGNAADILEQIMITYRGAMLFSEDTYKLKFRDLNYETPVMEINDDMVVEQGGQSTLSITQPSIFNTPNAVRMRWVNPEKKHTEDDYQLVDLAAQEKDGYIREEQIDVKGITSTENVMKMANYFLERLRLNKTAGLTSHSRAMQLEPHDLIWLTHTRPGWDKKIMRVNSMGIGFDGNVALSLEEEYDQFYDDIYEITEHVFHDTILPNIKDPVPSVSNVSMTEEQYFYRGRSFTRLKVDFERPLNYPWFDHCDVYLKIGDGDWKFMTTATNDYLIDPVEEGETYYARLVTVSIWGTKEDFDSAYTASKTIVGAIDAPPDVTGFTAMAAGDSVSIFADLIDRPDVFVYEVRSGAGWEGGLVVGQNETPNFRLVGMKPGTLTLWIKAMTNAGIYSAHAASTQVTVFGPSGYLDIDAWSWDYTTGTHDNTEHHVYNEVDCLRCAHSGGVLTGTWKSPIYDLGSIQTVRIWGDFIQGIDSQDLMWGGVFQPGDTWGDRIAPGQRWYQVWTPGEVGMIKATLLYDDFTPPEKEITGFEIGAPEISGRYVQVKVEIIDPNIATHSYLHELNMKTAYWS